MEDRAHGGTLGGMVKAALRSAGHALRGMVHAMRRERNVQLFLVPYIFVLLLGSRFSLQSSEWLALVLSGGLFFVTELLNTALERLTDVVDDHLKQTKCTSCFEMVKVAKDVAAAASLVSLVVTVVVVGVVFWPR